jgi:hypothetical protein
MKISARKKVIKRKARAQKKNRLTAISSKRRQNKETILKERKNAAGSS